MERAEWNDMIKEHAPKFGAFLQSYEWGMFQEAVGRRIERITIDGDEGRVMQGLGVWTEPVKGVSYLYFPKGPIGNMEENEMLSRLEGAAKEATFIRIEPSGKSTLTPVKDNNPRATILIDLTQEEEEMWKGMKSKTRYNARLGRRKGVEVRELDIKKEFDQFWLLMQQTATRDRIRLHEKSYYKAILKGLSQEEGAKAKIYGAFYEGRLLAANIIVDFLGVRTYLHGATSNLHRNVMAQYVLHTELMMGAKQDGMHTFDFWGVVSEQEEQAGHSWAGISRYKRSYGGEYVEMPGTFDLVTKPMRYEVYKMLRKIRRLF